MGVGLLDAGACAFGEKHSGFGHRDLAASPMG